MIVLDSSFLIAFHNQADFHHSAALEVMEDFAKGSWGQGLLPEYVFLEVVTVLLVRRSLRSATAVGSLLLGAKELDLIPCSEVFHDAWRMFASQVDTGLSFADCAVASVALHRDPSLVATFDRGFANISGITVVP